MAFSVLGPRYVKRFACIGSACEDSCCTGWSISIDQAHYKKMRRAFADSPEDLASFEQGVKLVSQGRTAQRYALVVLQPGSSDCSFLASDKLCNVQRKFGEHALPDVCSTYPRRQSFVDGRVEVAAVLSCPEAARQALLLPDAMELLELDTSFVVREMLMQVAEAGGGTYEQSVDVVRMAMLQKLAGSSKLSARLGALAALAELLGEAFGRGLAYDRTQVARIVQTFESTDWAAQMDLAMASIDMPLDVPMKPLLEILSKRAELPEGKFGALLAHAIAAYRVTETSSIAQIAAAYVERRASLASQVEPRLNEILTNFCLNHTFSYWFTGAPTLGVWVRGLILRVTLARFLVFAHPKVAELDASSSPEICARVIGEVCVEVIYQMCRTIDHHRPFVELLDRVLPEKLPGLEHALCLLKL